MLSTRRMESPSSSLLRITDISSYQTRSKSRSLTMRPTRCFRYKRHLSRCCSQYTPCMFIPQYSLTNILTPCSSRHGFNWFDRRGTEGVGFIRALRTLLTNNLPTILPDLSCIIRTRFTELHAGHPVKDGKSPSKLDTCAPLTPSDRKNTLRGIPHDREACCFVQRCLILRTRAR